MLEVEVKRIDAFRVGCVRHVGPYQEMPPAFGKLFAWAGATGRLGPGVRCLGLFYDNPKEVAPEALRAAACVVVDGAFDGDPEAGIEACDIEGGEYAVALHRGPYETLAESYDWLLGHWLPTSGRTLDPNPSFEVYLNSPQDTAPEELETELYMPLM